AREFEPLETIRCPELGGEDAGKSFDPGAAGVNQCAVNIEQNQTNHCAGMYELRFTYCEQKKHVLIEGARSRCLRVICVVAPTGSRLFRRLATGCPFAISSAAPIAPRRYG